MPRINLLGEDRAGRIRFLLTLLICVLIYVVPASILDSHQPNLSTVDNVFYTLLFFLSPALLLIVFAITARRLKDLGEMGWWVLLLVIPFVNIAFVFLLSILPSNQKNISQRDRFIRVAVLSVIVASTPFIIYFIQRYFGILPSAEEWYAQGGNHGPWRYSAAGFSVAFPLLGTMAIAGYETIESLRSNKTLKNVGVGALMIGLQIVALCLQVYFLWWTID